MKHPSIPQTDVLAWLQVNHPALHAVAEIDREWVWLPVDLRGDHNKPTRESIKEYGFRFKGGGHALPSGRSGTWAHSCTKPLPFHRKGGKPSQPSTQTETDPIAEALAALAA